MNKSEYEQIARDLHAVLLLGRALSPLEAEKNVDASLTHAELIALQYIYLLGEARFLISASDLAGVLKIDRARVSHILKKLEEPDNHYVIRRYELPHRLLLELTERGKRIAKQAVESDLRDLLNIIELVEDKIHLKFLKTLLGDIHDAIIAALPAVIEERKKRYDHENKP